MFQIVYLHGFASSGESQTVRDLRALGYDVIAPTYHPHDPESTLDQLIPLMESLDSSETILIGSSLGGFWVEFFSSQYGFKHIVVNPSLRPSMSMARYVGVPVKNYSTGEDIQVVQTWFPPFGVQQSETVVILGEKDDVINPWFAQSCYKPLTNDIIVVPEMGHRLDDVGRLVPWIEKLRNNVIEFPVAV